MLYVFFIIHHDILEMKGKRLSKYDDIMKRLGRLRPHDFIEWLCPELQSIQKVSFEDREFELTHRRVDTLYLIDEKDIGKFLLHLEFQAQLKDDFSIRMHEYSTRIRKEYKLPVMTVALFLESGKDVINLDPVDRCELAGKLISEFHYTKIILPENDWRTVIDKKIVALLPLIPLTKIPKGEELKALNEAKESIENLSDQILKGEMAAIFYLIGGYRYKEFIRKIIGEKLMLDLMQSDTYRETIEIGELKERKKIATNMLKKGMEIFFVSETTGLSKAEVIELQKQLQNPSS